MVITITILTITILMITILAHVRVDTLDALYGTFLIKLSLLCSIARHPLSLCPWPAFPHTHTDAHTHSHIRICCVALFK